MARQTKKYKSAIETVRNQNIRLGNRDHESVYEALESGKFFWNSKLGTWEKKEFKPSTSVFEADDGMPTGLAKVRVMAHPDDVPKMIEALKKSNDFRVVDISKPYKNRRGSGERVYTTILLEN